jgi:hypothetical protein
VNYISILRRKRKNRLFQLNTLIENGRKIIVILVTVEISLKGIQELRPGTEGS